MKIKDVDKKIKELNELKKKNKLFKKLSPSERRVEVAKDALIQLQKGVWKSKQGAYVNFSKEMNMNETCSFEKVSCEVCARGALFLGAVNKFNDYDPSVLGEKLNHIKILDCEDFGDVEERLWSKKQTELIEMVFESYCSENEAEDSLIQTWHNKYSYAHDRLCAILKNIIRNNGTFVLNDPKDVGKK